jgi:parallel beta-helix repeat protein
MYNIRAPVRFVVIDGIDIDAKGLAPNPVGFSDFSEHIRFQNLEIRYGIGSCITQGTSNELTHKDFDLQFINTKIHSCGVPFDTNTVGGVLARKSLHARFWHGWYLHAGGASFIGSESYNHAGTGLGPDGNNIVVRNSYIHDNAVQGIYVSGGDDWLIENNVFYNNGRYEIYNFGGKRHRIRNNTIVAGPRNDFATTGNISAGIYLHAGSQGSIHEYNIIDGFRYGVANQSAASEPNIVRDNLIRSKPPGSEIYNYHGAKPPVISGNILNLDPLFINPPAGDFRLQAKSPAIARGVSGGNWGAK